MLKVFYKENLNELVDESGLSKKEINLINKCKEAFNYEIEVLEIRMDPYFNSSTVDIDKQDEYKQLSKLINSTYLEYKKLISNMKKTGEYNYKFLDLILYNSINVYIHTSEYGLKSYDEVILPVAKVILSKFGHNLNSSNFPISYKYFVESINQDIYVQGENFEELILATCQIGKILKFRENKTELKRHDIINFLKSVIWLKEAMINFDFSITELKFLASFDFSEFKYSDLNTVISILEIMFNKYHLFNEYDTSALDSLEVELTETIIKKIFKYLSECVNFLKENRDSLDLMPVDECNYTYNKLVIELIFNNIKRDCICHFYDDEEFESCVNNVLEEILEIAYYREYKRKINMVKSKLISKSDLIEEIEIPF